MTEELSHVHDVLSTTLATTLHININSECSYDPTPSCGLLERFRNAKILRASRKIELDVARILLRDDRESPLDLLPSLNKIDCKLDRMVSESNSASALDDFRSFVLAAQRRAGRPVKVFWDLDPEILSRDTGGNLLCTFGYLYIPRVKIMQMRIFSAYRLGASHVELPN